VSMFKLLERLVLPYLGMGFADGGDPGKGDDKDGKVEEVKVSKADYDAVVAKADRSDKLEKDLEDLKLEVFSPDYMSFLDAKDTKPKGDEKPDAKTGEDLSDEAIEKMSKKELLAKAKELAKQELEPEIRSLKESSISSSKEQTQREIKAFARTHADFDTYRPIMYGLSCDPKNSELSLQELYDASKEHVKRIHTEPSEAEKEKQRKSKGEKPGGDGESFERLKKLSPGEAASEALKETKDKLGPIPSA